MMAKQNYLCLSPRQIQVIKLVAKGLQNKEIAAKLNISVHGAKDHIARLYAATGVNNKVLLARLAWEMGIV